MLEMLESKALAEFSQTMTFQDIRGKHPADVYTHPLQDAEGQEREYAYMYTRQIVQPFTLHLPSREIPKDLVIPLSNRSGYAR